MKYWLITGLRQERHIYWLRENLARLRSSPVQTELVFVETGEVTGLWKEGHVLQEPKVGVVPFLMRAMTYVQKHAGPEDWFVRVDGDDYYGPSYLAGVESVRRAGAEATGMPSVYVGTEDLELYFCKSKRPFRGACGGTLAGSIAESVDFRDTGYPWGEDSQWVSDMLDLGRRVVPRGPKDYAIMRWQDGGHTYPVDGHALPHFWNCHAYHLGGFSGEKVGRDFVGGEEPIPLDAVAAIRGMRSLHHAARL